MGDSDLEEENNNGSRISDSSEARDGEGNGIKGNGVGSKGRDSDSRGSSSKADTLDGAVGEII